MSDIKEKIDAYLTYRNYYVLGPSIAYCPNKNRKGYKDMLLMADIFGASDSNVGTMLWRSQDAGKTWDSQGLIERSYIYDFENSSVKSGYGAIYADDKNGVLLFIANDTYWEKGHIASVWRKRTLYYRLSFDNGYTWTDKKYIIQKGTDSKGEPYNKDHFLKDVTFGTNMAATVSPRVIRAEDNTLLVSVQVQIVDEKDGVINPSSMGFMKCGAMKGTWNEGSLDYQWNLGEYASVTQEESTRGVFEPTFERIGEKKIIMVMRGSNLNKEEQIEGVKFYSISQDNGMTWTKPIPLKYDDGSTMYSSSCIPKIIRHSNGKLFFIGVINKSNPKGNLPRYPLCIAELDPNRGVILKETITIIDTKRASQDETICDAYPVDFSNHGIYEDENTGDIIVLAPMRPNLAEFGSVLNKYVIKV
jgi:hypothetical protein